jgi:biopolymer transport protein ExbB
MVALYDVWDGVRDLMEQGGVVLQAIAVLILVMWTLIAERIWYYKFAVAKDVAAALQTWAACSEPNSRRAQQIRAALISRVSEKIDQSIPLIRAMVILAPLLGLLGTVTGIISVFEIMAITDSGGARSLSEGVAKSAIPIMAGLVAAIAGLLGQAYLEKLARGKKALLEDQLTVDS